VVLALLLFALVWALGVFLFSSHSIISAMKNMYNQTSPGLLATNLLHLGQSDPKQPSPEWVSGDGSLQLSFGRIGSLEKEYFCVSVGVEGKPEAGVNGGLVPGTMGEKNDTVVGEKGIRAEENGISIITDNSMRGSNST
jgi:hypothetical protein